MIEVASGGQSSTAKHLPSVKSVSEGRSVQLQQDIRLRSPKQNFVLSQSAKRPRSSLREKSNATLVDRVAKLEGSARNESLDWRTQMQASRGEKWMVASE